MKKSIALSLLMLAALSTVASAQVRFVEAPYPGAVPQQSAQTPPIFPPGMLRPAPTTSMQPGFEVTAADGNLRKALVRWTKMIGWTFEPEHWTLDRDIPVAGSASLGSDFKMAARALLSSTEMTDLPAQPCFYSNNVLRVIPFNELCSRQQAPKSQ